MTSFDRLKKSLSHQYESLVEVDIKVGNLIKRRQERENAGPEYFRLLEFAKKAKELQEEFNRRQQPKPKKDDHAADSIQDVNEIVNESIKREDQSLAPLTQLAGRPRKDEKYAPFISPYLAPKSNK